LLSEIGTASIPEDVTLHEASVVTRYPDELGKLQEDFTQPIVKDIILRGRELEWIRKQF
jgi:hypothetical protein